MQVDNWTKEVDEKVRLSNIEVATTINDLKADIIKAQNDIQQWWEDTSLIVSKCIELHASEAETFLNKVEEDTIRCIDNEVNTILKLFSSLDKKSAVAMKAAKTIFNEMEFCIQEKSYDTPSRGRCLTRVLVRNKKQMNLLGELGLLFARTSLAVVTLPDELQTCLLPPLMNAGLKIGEVVIDISACYINSVMEELFGDFWK
ncbi:hypothetical protein EVAR_52940_1 [Eumeta japonica]|uniref:Uncharacterized protein n=1 Tax=Eumeta variegata TaxID=151549 RepID=A0A4C1XPQ6_EUMVA|nr:hypothetical protein EVAR_52940_1 [Eumeta japonica]